MSSNPNNHNNFSLARFESMLKTNSVYFFDSEEIEHIVEHYLEIGKFALARKANKLGLDQHPSSTNLKLIEVDMYIFEDKLDLAEELLDKISQLEPSNEEIYVQKASIYSRRYMHEEAIIYLEKALEISNYEAIDLYDLIGMEYLYLEDYPNALYYFKKYSVEENEDSSVLCNIVFLL